MNGTSQSQPHIFRKTHAALLIALIVCLLAPFLHAAEVTVFAAASLTDVLKAAATTYEKQSSDKIVFNFGASSLLERQIEEGAPTDIFFSADEAKMDRLATKGFILKDTRKSRLSNALVIIESDDSDLKITSPADLARPAVRRIALADPKAVPAGIYSKEFLQRENLWDKVQPKIVPVDNVRAALAAVESGSIDVGMVYKTDASISKRVKIAYEVPAASGPKISYPIAVVKNSKQVEPARKFVDYLGSDDAAKLFESYGFIVLK